METTQLENARQMYAAALEKLTVAKQLHRLGYFNDSLSRAYYAAFHAISLLLYVHDQSYSSHGQLIGAFNKIFIATGKLDKQLGKAIGRLFDQRQVADYDIFEKADAEESNTGIQDAEYILSEIKSFIESTFSIRIN